MARNPRIVARENALRQVGLLVPVWPLPEPMRHGQRGTYRERRPREPHYLKRPARKVTVW